MPEEGYFDTIFAENGDVTTVPDALEPGGTVSFDQGYPLGYEIPPGDPGYLPVERDKMNYIFQVITEAIQQYQQHGTPPFITSAMNGGSPFSYSKYDRVLLTGVVYTSIADSNTQTPPDTNWTSGTPVDTGGTGLAAITAHNMIVGNGASAVTLLPPSAASGIALVSKGASLDPAYDTVVIAGGGTGQTNAAGAFGALKQDATTSATGVVELATDAEVSTGTSTTLVSPVSSMVFHKGIAKAWVVFNGQGTPAIKSAFNVSSITDNGTGDYTINFTTAFADANYTYGGSAEDTDGTGDVAIGRPNGGTKTTGAIRIKTTGGTSSLDFADVAITFHGNR